MLFRSVGFYDNDSGQAQTLVEQWDGTSWSIIDSVNASTTQNNYLDGVACASGQCFAVGFYYNDSGYPQTLTKQWNGATWSVVPSPDASPTGYNGLYGVTCLSQSDCTAVGFYFDDGDYPHTLIEHWDGSSWSIVTSPNTSATADNELNSVTCISNSDCKAVGWSESGGNVQTLIEQYSLSVPPLTGVVSELVHGSAGPFDINLPLSGPPGIECRSSNSRGAGNYTLIFTFLNPLISVSNASVTSGTGSVSSSNINPSNPNQYIVNLTGVTDSQYITVTLTGVVDSQNNMGQVSATMGVLIGDTSADGAVNSADISQTKSQSGRVVTNSNFREDVNADGALNSADISLVKSKSGTALP